MTDLKQAAQAARDLLADLPSPDGYYSASNEVIRLLDAALALPAPVPQPLGLGLSDGLGAVAVARKQLPGFDSTADQCRALGIAVGDTIEGRETAGRGYWHEARLTLLWLGDDVAVWRTTERSSERPVWSEPEEHADWTLECRQWRKVSA